MATLPPAAALTSSPTSEKKAVRIVENNPTETKKSIATLESKAMNQDPISKLFSSFVWTWNFVLAIWTTDRQDADRAVQKLQQNFERIPVEKNLMWNVIMYCALTYSLLQASGLSEDFLDFSNKAFLLPCLFGSILFYQQRFGWSILKLGVEDLWAWIGNWFAMTGIALPGLCQTIFIYALGSLVGSFLPESMQFYVQFPQEEQENSLRVAVYAFWALFAIHLVTLPLWKRGYDMSMTLAGRKNAEISYWDIFMDLVYNSCQSATLLYSLTVVLVLLQNKFGLKVHMIHLAMSLLEGYGVHVTAIFSFAPVHELCHKIPALQNMSHIEHHLAKSTFATTAGFGLWEPYINGTPFFMIPFLVCLPHLFFQFLYLGANVITHTMFPTEFLCQWHIFHHVAHADVHAGNIPSANDRKHSKFIKAHGEKLEKASIMMKHAWMPDLAGLATALVFGSILHYGFGQGFFHLDWSEAIHSFTN